MFRFFTQKHWLLWSWIGSAIILSSLWIQVKIDVKINEWFGEFYDMIQKAFGAPNSITIDEYWASLLSFITLAAMYVGVAVIVSFFPTKEYEAIAAFEVTLTNLSTNVLSIVIKFFHQLIRFD